MVGREHHDVLAFAHLLIQPAQETAQQFIRTQREVKHLVRVRAKSVPSHVVGRETNAQEIGRLCLPQFFPCDRPEGEIEQYFAAERREIEGVVELLTILNWLAGFGIEELATLATQTAVQPMRERGEEADGLVAFSLYVVGPALFLVINVLVAAT